MKKIAWILLFLASSAHAQAPADSSEDRRAREEVQSASTLSLKSLQKLVTEQNAKSLGFDSPQQTGQASIGPALPVYLVRLDGLKAYRPDADPNALLGRLDKAIVSVLVDGQARSSITVEKVKDRWQATSFGAPSLIRAISQAVQQSAAASGTPSDAYFLVHVAALSTYYVGHREQGGLLLTTVTEDRALSKPAGTTLPAAQVFAALVPIAQSYNGLPL